MLPQDRCCTDTRCLATQVTERWMQGYKMEAAKLVDPRSLPGKPVLRWAGAYLATMAVALLLLVFSALLLVWKVGLLAACTGVA